MTTIQIPIKDDQKQQGRTIKSEVDTLTNKIEQLKTELEIIMRKIDQLKSIHTSIRNTATTQKIKEDSLLKDIGDYETESDNKERNEYKKALSYLKGTCSKLLRFGDMNIGAYEKIDSLSNSADLIIDEMETILEKLKEEAE